MICFPISKMDAQGNRHINNLSSCNIFDVSKGAHLTGKALLGILLQGILAERK